MESWALSLLGCRVCTHPICSSDQRCSVKEREFVFRLIQVIWHLAGFEGLVLYQLQAKSESELGSTALRY